MLIQRLRGEEKKTIGQSNVNIGTTQGVPELGISTSIFMTESLEEGDIIGIEVLGNNSFLRSSEWNLLRLEGHMVEDEGFLCNMENKNMECSLKTKEIDALQITEPGFYELALHGQVILVSIFQGLSIQRFF